MHIIYNTLSQEAKGIVDALQVFQETGSASKEKSLKEISKEITVTDEALKKGDNVIEIDTLLDYRNRLENVKTALQRHFK